MVVAILACFYAGYSDMKRGIIPNKLTLPLIGIGILLNGVYAFMINDLWIVVKCATYVVVIFIIGYVLWRAGAWAGGDVKLFTALAALIPFYPSFAGYTLLGVKFPVIATYPFPFTVIINSIISMFPFLLIYVLFISIKKKPHLLDELLTPIKEYRKNIVLTLVITSAITITFLVTYYLPYQIIILSLIIIYLLTMVISKLPNRIKAVVISVAVVFALYENFELTVSSIIVLLLSITILGIIIKLITSVSREALQEDVPIQDLKEGMISAYNIYKRDDMIYVDDKGIFEKIKEAIKSGDMSLIAPKGKPIISSMAAGLTEDDIKLLQALAEEGRIKNRFRIKKGVPFAPSIFIGLMISLFVGDLAFIFQKVIYSIYIYL